MLFVWKNLNLFWTLKICLIFLASCAVLAAITASVESSRAQVPKNDVFYDYPSSPRRASSDLLTTMLLHDDFLSDVKMLPNRKDVILHLTYKQEMSLIFVMAEAGPVSLSLSPCYGILKWDLLWRSFPEGLDIDPSASEAENSLNVSEIHGFGNDSAEEEVLNHFEMEREKRELRKRSEKFGNVQIVQNNFTVQEIRDPRVIYYYKNNRPLVEVLLNRGEGRDPWMFNRESTQPGIYVIKVRSLSDRSRLHAMASKNHGLDEEQQRELRTFKVKDNFKKHSVVLSWSSRADGGKLFCLAVSRIKFYSSLCAARELQSSYKILPPPLVDESLILGCTPNNFYNLPVIQTARYFVSLWKQGSLVPFVQAIVKSKPHRKSQRLKPGKMIEFTLTNGGFISTKFIINKSGKRLHIGAVSCYGGVKVLVLAGKERVAMAKGREALHLAIRHAPKATLTIKVSPQPPIQKLYRVHLVATHSARRLPIPRLPKKIYVKATPKNCSSAEIVWTKAPGGPTYCVVLQKHPSGRPPEIRPPLQCGWEEVIRRPDYFDFIDCFKGDKEKRQSKTITGLTPNGSFLVNVLVRHKVTGRTLTLAPTMLNLPKCFNSFADDILENIIKSPNKIQHHEMSNEV